LMRLLAGAWPELEIVGMARNGREAVEMFEASQPQICFLDVQMPGMTGVEAARHIGTRAHLVFVTAFQQYAIEAFDQGALDYLVKPIEPARLSATVKRLQERVRTAQPALNDELLQQLARAMHRDSAPPSLRWLRASVGNTVRLIDVAKVDFLRSEDKYTLVAYRDENGAAAEAVVRTPLKDLLMQLDATQFAQVHRSVVVNLSAVGHVTRGENETADIHLKGRSEVLPVSRAYLHLFRQM
ncbi:MAG: response regulator transcription factor, partial [Steroidobacteraceae bacterium]|nr:response regulator transcription factor [Steroidobacteraceae bacterium]